MEIQKLLPKSSFVPFKARRLTKANIVYANLNLFHDYGYFKVFDVENEDFYKAVLDYFAYIIPTNDDEYSLVDKVEKEFLAERYGGAGIFSNGGGARCGLIGPFNVKGIGLNPVTGDGEQIWYNHGGMGLQEGLTELFYSHVAEIALPYSSSRVLAVIDTGGFVLQRAYTDCLNPEDDERQIVRRALIVRESKIRPAYFGRAVYFKPSNYMKNNQPHDYQRVKDAIPLLPKLMDVNNPANSIEQNIKIAIEKILFTSAVQLACSKVRRIMHGSLGLSNLLINGGWIDFGSATVVPSYAQLITAEFQPAYWNEVGMFQKTTSDLCFYAGKHYPSIKPLIGNGTNIYQKFLHIYRQQLCVLFVELTGIPLVFTRELLNDIIYENLGAILLHIATHEDPKPQTSKWVLHGIPPAHHWGTSSLRSVLLKLFFSYWIQQSDTAPDLPFEKPLIDNLWNSYKTICISIETAAKSHSIKREHLIIFIAFNMAKQVIGLKPLYRGHMLNYINAAIESSDSASDLRNKIREIHSRYHDLSILHYKASANTDLLIAITHHNICLFLDMKTGKFRLDIPEESLIKMFNLKSIPHLKIVVDGIYYFFTLHTNKNRKNYFSTSFDFFKEGSISNRSKVYVCHDHLTSINDIFPDLNILYESYYAILKELPISEELEIKHYQPQLVWA